MSRKCSNCGADLQDGALFCTNCGTKVPEEPVGDAVQTTPVEEFNHFSADPVPSDPVPNDPVPSDPYPSAPEPVPAEAAAPEPSKPEPKTDTEAAFGVAPTAPGAAYSTTAPAQENERRPEPVQAAPVPPVEEEYIQDPKALRPVSTAGFFWLSFVYCIPVIGLIVCIIVAAASKNLNIKHHACAKLVAILVWFIICIAISILTVIAFNNLGIDFNEYWKKVMELYNYVPR